MSTIVRLAPSAVSQSDSIVLADCEDVPWVMPMPKGEMVVEGLTGASRTNGFCEALRAS